MNSPAVIKEILSASKTIAVIGVSDKPARASFNIARYLMDSGYRVLPINPLLTEVLGVPCYADLDAAQAVALKETGAGIDLVNVFRASEFVPGIVDDVLRLGIPSLWLQDDIVHDEAVAHARAAGVKVVESDCILRQHAGLLSL